MLSKCSLEDMTKPKLYLILVLIVLCLTMDWILNFGDCIFEAGGKCFSVVEAKNLASCIRDDLSLSLSQPEVKEFCSSITLFQCVVCWNWGSPVGPLWALLDTLLDDVCCN